MRILLIGLGATAALAACSGGADNGSAPANNDAAAAGAEAQDQVRAMPEAERNVLLIGAIKGRNMSCENVESSILSQTSRNVPVYLATCQDGAVYAVAIADDGSSTVKAVTPAEEKGR